MAYVISVANQKGGVGKTTTTFNLAVALKKLGHRVLVVDNDPQGNLTSYCSVENLDGLTTDKIYISRQPRPLALNELTEVKDGIHIIPTDTTLSGVEYYLMAKPDKEFYLKKALSGLYSDFDFIIIDNPPAVNLLTINGLVATNGVVVPLQMEFFSLEGVVHIEKTIESLKDKNPDLKLLGLLPSMFDARRKLHLEVKSLLLKEFESKVFSTSIRDSVKVAESTGHGKSIHAYAPSSRSAEEFNELAKEVVSRCQNLS